MVRFSNFILALKLRPAEASLFYFGADNGDALCHAVYDGFVFLDGVDAVLVWHSIRGRSVVVVGGGGGFGGVGGGGA